MGEGNYSHKINQPKDKIPSTQVSEIEIETKTEVFAVEFFDSGIEYLAVATEVTRTFKKKK
jgi:hypothetical protein